MNVGRSPVKHCLRRGSPGLSFLIFYIKRRGKSQACHPFVCLRLSHAHLSTNEQHSDIPTPDIYYASLPPILLRGVGWDIYISNAGIHCVTLMMIDSKLARFQTIIPKRIALAPITKCAFSYFCHIGRPLLPFVDGMVYSVVNAWAKLRAFFDNSNITPFFFRILRPSAVFRMSRARVQYLYLQGFAHQLSGLCFCASGFSRLAVSSVTS